MPLARCTIFSPDRVYRYTLWRDWTGEFKDGVFFTEDPHLDYYPGRRDTYVQFIGLNPSTADEAKDDATIRICRGFAQRWGFGAMCMTNLFAFRATKPADMKRQSNPAGDDNTVRLLECASEAGLVVAAWGNDGRYGDQDKYILSELRKAGVKLHCLRTTRFGCPAHPLRTPYSINLSAFAT